MLTTILLAIIAVCLLGWHRCHEQLRESRQDRRFLQDLAEQLEREIHASQAARRRAAPSPRYWSGSVFDELWRDIQRAGRLQVVADDEPEAS